MTSCDSDQLAHASENQTYYQMPVMTRCDPDQVAVLLFVLQSIVYNNASIVQVVFHFQLIKNPLVTFIIFGLFSPKLLVLWF